MLYGEDGRDCEGREGCVGRTAETAREGGLSGDDGRDCQGGRLCGEDDRDCDGGRVMWVGWPRLRGEEGCVGRMVETARGGRVMWEGGPRLPGRTDV